MKTRFFYIFLLYRKLWSFHEIFLDVFIQGLKFQTFGNVPSVFLEKGEENSTIYQIPILVWLFPFFLIKSQEKYLIPVGGQGIKWFAQQTTVSNSRIQTFFTKPQPLNYPKKKTKKNKPKQLNLSYDCPHFWHISNIDAHTLGGTNASIVCLQTSNNDLSNNAL